MRCTPPLLLALLLMATDARGQPPVPGRDARLTIGRYGSIPLRWDDSTRRWTSYGAPVVVAYPGGMGTAPLSPVDLAFAVGQATDGPYLHMDNDFRGGTTPTFSDPTTGAPTRDWNPTHRPYFDLRAASISGPGWSWPLAGSAYENRDNTVFFGGSPTFTATAAP